MGGMDEEGHYLYKDGECYDPATNEWVKEKECWIVKLFSDGLVSMKWQYQCTRVAQQLSMEKFISLEGMFTIGSIKDVNLKTLIFLSLQSWQRWMGLKMPTEVFSHYRCMGDAQEHETWKVP